MLDPSSALILFALFQATEKIIGYAGGKIADAMTQPVWDAAEEHAKWLAGKDDTARRWQAFGQAFAEARARFERDAPNPDVARRVSGVLEKLALKPDADREWLARLAPELEKASLISERPDASVVAYLLASAFEKGDGVAPSRADLADATAVFVSAFQDRLFAQPAYQELMLRRAWWEQLRQPRYDTRERYLAQLIDCNQDLDFVGIPELKDRQALRIEDVFIHLQAEVQLEPERGALVERIARGEEFGERLAETAERLTRYPRETLKRRLAANAALREYPRMAVLGDPGAGKTTLLKYIAIAFAQMQSGKLGLNEDRLPIFVRLYDYVAKQAERQADYSLVDYLYTQARETLLLTLEPGFFESALERGECCVCLDGLDELGGAGLRREVTAAVEALANKYPRNRYLVTSRSVGYEEAPLDRREFVHHTILPLSDDDIRAFVPKWYAAREKNPAVARERAEHLTKTIMAEPRIKSLAANPLMLTIIALVHRIEAELPHERVKLYDKCVTALVETWEEVKRLRVEDRQRPYYKHRRRLLEQLAGWMHAQPGESGRAREVKEGDLELQLRRFLLDNPKLQLDDEDARQEAQAFIGLAKGRTGLLVERGEGIYAFAHLTFQEYLAAADIERRLVHNIDAMWDEIQPRLHDPHWREVILLLLGSLNRFEKPPTELVSRIFKRTDEYEDVLHRHLLLAARALADRVEVDVALRDAIVDRLLAIARSDELAQYDALAALGSLQGNSRAAAGLLALARDAQVEGWVRSAAALALGQLGRADEAASILLALARGTQVDAEVRYAAASALGQLGRADEAVVSGLLALARDAQVDAGVRRAAYDSLKALLRGERESGG